MRTIDQRQATEMLTRVVELAVHGLDLAATLDRRPWLTPETGRAVEQLLLDQTAAVAVRSLGWDEITFLRRATGREQLSEAEKRRISQTKVRWLALG